MTDSAPIEIQNRSGLTLRGESWGKESDAPVLFLHGGGQTRHAWGATAVALADQGLRAITLDARGHGKSDQSPQGHYKFLDFADDLIDWMESLQQRPMLVGASLGGITSLVVEGQLKPGSASAIVLVDITPRFEPEGVGRIVDFMRAAPDGFASLEEAADAVARYLPHRPRPKNLNGLRKNLREGKDGRFRWHWDPRIMTEGNLKPPEDGGGIPLRDAARALDLPTLLVRGAMSDVVSPEGAREFLEDVPEAEFVDVSDARHMVAGDSNNAFTEAIVGFLKKVHS